jgi:hypothetical protein
MESGEKREEEICSAARRRTTNGAEARRVSELWRVASCGSGDHEGRRTKLDFSSGKPFDDLHWSTAFGGWFRNNHYRYNRYGRSRELGGSGNAVG